MESKRFHRDLIKTKLLNITLISSKLPKKDSINKLFITLVQNTFLVEYMHMEKL